MAGTPAVCEHVHLPVQSGSNAVLKRMLRRYTRERYLEVVAELRAAIPGITFSTDIIVGFPGETEAQFEETLSLVAEADFDDAYTFKYSVREGTPAVRLRDHVPEEVGAERLRAAHRGGARPTPAERASPASARPMRPWSSGRPSGAASCWRAPAPITWCCSISRESAVGEYHRVRLTGTTGSTFTGCGGHTGPGGPVIHNLVEAHVVAAYDAMRPHFPDFCGCETCREDALVYTLNRHSGAVRLEHRPDRSSPR